MPFFNNLHILSNINNFFSLFLILLIFLYRLCIFEPFITSIHFDPLFDPGLDHIMLDFYDSFFVFILIIYQLLHLIIFLHLDITFDLLINTLIINIINNIILLQTLLFNPSFNIYLPHLHIPFDLLINLSILIILTNLISLQLLSINNINIILFIQYTNIPNRLFIKHYISNMFLYPINIIQ